MIDKQLRWLVTAFFTMLLVLTGQAIDENTSIPSLVTFVGGIAAWVAITGILWSIEEKR